MPDKKAPNCHGDFYMPRAKNTNKNAQTFSASPYASHMASLFKVMQALFQAFGKKIKHVMQGKEVMYKIVPF